MSRKAIRTDFGVPLLAETLARTRSLWTFTLWNENMNRYRAGHVRFTMSVAPKLGFALLVAVALAASNFQGTTLAADSSQTSPTLHARITRAQAERAALAKVPGGKVKSAKLARENGQLIWSIDIVTPLTKKIAAVQVDARSGKVLSKLTQTPGDRAEEPVAGQKKKQ
jgi:uncharacterized membrane protein YkoI